MNTIIVPPPPPLSENRMEIEMLTGGFKEEKQLRKKYELDLKALQEECGELREEKENLERVGVLCIEYNVLIYAQILK